MTQREEMDEAYNNCRSHEPSMFIPSEKICRHYFTQGWQASANQSRQMIEKERERTIKLAERNIEQYAVFESSLIAENQRSQKLVEALKQMSDNCDCGLSSIALKAISDYEGKTK